MVSGVRESLAIRKEEELKIDPSTAEVTWWYAQVLDPYDAAPTFQRLPSWSGIPCSQTWR